MAWSSGEKITAAKLKSHNGSLSYPKYYGHQGWSWRYIDLYWYNTRVSGEVMLHYTSSRTAGCEHQLELYRYENGGWVHKGTWHGSTTQLNGNYDSRGPGKYHLHFWDHNNTPTFTIYPSTSSNIYQGHKLAMLSAGPVVGSSSEINSLNPRSNGKIYASDLNAGRVYTL